MSIGSDGEREVIRVTAESTAVDLLRGTARYYTDTDQRGRAVTLPPLLQRPDLVFFVVVRIHRLSPSLVPRSLQT